MFGFSNSCREVTIVRLFEPSFALQKLRGRCLLIRELCHRWDELDDLKPCYQDAALLVWRANRLIAGWLHAHPNPRHHPKSSAWGWAIRAVRAAAVAVVHRRAATRARWLHAQFVALGKDCADIRAVTSSVAINQLLAAHQPGILALQKRFALQEQWAPPIRQQTAVRIVIPISRSSEQAGRLTAGQPILPFLSV